MREETGKQFFILESTDDSEVCVFGAGGGATGLSHITLACSHELYHSPRLSVLIQVPYNIY